MLCISLWTTACALFLYPLDVSLFRHLRYGATISYSGPEDAFVAWSTARPMSRHSQIRRDREDNYRSFLAFFQTKLVSGSNATGFPASNHFRIATVTKDINGTITDFQDRRPNSFTAGGGGGANPNGYNGDLQTKNGAVLAAGGENDDGTGLTVGRDFQGKGPNPGFDIRAYGSRMSSQASAATTCTTTGGSAVVKVAVAQTFINGSGIMCIGAGAATALSTPVAPTATASQASTPMGTGKTVAGGTGTTSYTYEIVAEDFAGGLTTVSTGTTITNGNASLGSQSVGISSWTQVVNSITFTTAATHGISTGAMVEITGDQAFGNPFYCMATAIDATHFSCTTNQDTRNGAQTSGGNTGTVTWRNANHVLVTSVRGGFRYWIYGGSCGLHNICGVTLPQAQIGSLVSDPLNLTWDDWGLGGTGVPPHPPWIPSSVASNPAKAQNLVTTIVSGAGTTTLTLAAIAGTSVSGQTFKECADPGIQAAVAAVIANGIDSGYVLIPATTGGASSFNTCGVITPSLGSHGVAFKLAGSLTLGDTFICTGKCQMVGDLSMANSPQFSRRPYVAISGNGAPLLLWTRSTGTTLRNLTFNMNGQATGWLDDGAGNGIPAWTANQLAFTSATNDHLARGLVERANINNGADFIMDDVSFFTGQSGVNTPAFLITGNNGNFTMKNIFLAKRGMFFGNGLLAHINELYCEGCITPEITINYDVAYGGGGGTVGVSLFNTIQDTTFAPLFSDIGFSNSGVISAEVNVGVPFQQVTAVGNGLLFKLTGMQLLRTSQVAAITKQLLPPGLAIEGINSAGVTGQVPYEIENVNLSFGANYSSFWNALPPPAPTITAASGGSVTVGGHIVKIAYVYPTSGAGFAAGPYSRPSNSATTVGGTQSLTFTGLVSQLGAVGYAVIDSTDGGNSFFTVECATPFVAGQPTTFTWSTARCGQSAPTYSGGGPTSASRSGLFSPTIGIASPGGFLSNLGSLATATRAVNLPDAAGTVLLDSTATSAGRLAPAPYDNFNRANGALGSTCPPGYVTCWTSNYSTNGSLTITSNQVLGTNASNNQNSYWTGNSFLNDQYAEVTIATTSANQQGVSLRNSGTTNATTNLYMCVENGTSQLQIAKVTNGGFGSLTTTAITGASGNRLRFTAVSATLTCSITSAGGTVTTISTTDSAFTGGAPGIFDARNTGGLTNWTGGSLQKNAAFVTEEQEFNGHQHINNGALTVGNFPTASTGTALVNGEVYAQAGYTDQSVSASLPICTDANKKYTTTSCNIPIRIASGTATLGTSPINSGACAKVVTVSATGVATTDVITAGFNADVSGVTGYGPSATGSLYIRSYPTANNVNFLVCNSTSGSITPGTATLNWNVIR